MDNMQTLKPDIIFVEDTGSSSLKWIIALISAILFFLIINQFTVKGFNALFKSLNISLTGPGGLTWFGVVFLTLLFFFISRLIMW